MPPPRVPHSARMQGARSHNCHAACTRVLHGTTRGERAGAADSPGEARRLPGTRALHLLRSKAQHQPSTQQQRRRHMHRPRRQHPRRSPPTRATPPLDRAIHAREAAAPPTPNHPQQSGPPRAHCQRQRHPPRWMRMSATSRRKMRRSCGRREAVGLNGPAGVAGGLRRAVGGMHL